MSVARLQGGFCDKPATIGGQGLNMELRNSGTQENKANGTIAPLKSPFVITGTVSGA
jgi:hypothetical protein